MSVKHQLCQVQSSEWSPLPVQTPTLGLPILPSSELLSDCAAQQSFVLGVGWGR